jgi:hypothetical protein
MKKMVSFVLGLASGFSFMAGFLLLISNIQGQRMPDGHPLDPWWLVWGLTFVVPALATFLAVALWPESKRNTLQPVFTRDTL